MAKVTQTCVRTNEDFEVDLEFDLFAVVRSIQSREQLQDDQELGGMSIAQIEGSLGGGRGARNKKGGGKKKRSGGGNAGSGLDNYKMKEIELLLQDFDLEDDVVEDESVFSDGTLDVGELVAQMFRLKLDPYPKKPGTEPVSYTITG